MINIKPDFYPEFSCIADRCTDSCCIGWEIDIDENTLNKYKSIDGAFGENLRKSISFDGTAHFELIENDRCPHLNENGLCNLIINCGEECLCDICREHPRFYEWYGEYRDCGIGLCCEEACRLLFSSEKPLTFLCEADESTDDNDIENEVAQRIFEIRSSLIEILSERENITLKSRIKKCCDYILSLQDEQSEAIPLKAEEAVNEIFKIIKESEPFDEEWEIYLSSFSFEKMKKRADFSFAQFERLLSYFIFRHFTAAVYDDELVTHLKLCLLLFIITLMYTQSNDETEKIKTVKYISKQFEYSYENMQLLEFECEANAKISFKSLLNCIDYLI